jgi:hypothetical protein
MGLSGSCCDGTPVDERVEDFGEVTLCMDENDYEITNAGGYWYFGSECSGCEV